MAKIKSRHTKNNRKITERYIDLGVYCVLAGIIGILYYHTIFHNYWLYDDLQILRHALEYHPWEYFFIPEVWQQLSSANLTPWVSLSFDADLSLFGFELKWFYLHHLISLWLVAVMMYIVLKLWIPRLFAFLGAMLFLLGAPAAVASELLMLRHYIEGAVLTLLSFYLFVLALRKESFLLAGLSAVVYFLAVSAKEIYFPLALVILFFPEKTGSVLKYSIPLLCAFSLYILWRFRMLGGIGGYQDTILPDGLNPDFLEFIFRNIFESVNTLSGSSTISHIVYKFVIFLFLILTTVTFIRLLYKRRFSILIFFFVLTSSVYFAILPLFNSFSTKDFLSYRFMFFVSIFFSVIISCSYAYIFSIADERTENSSKNKKWLHAITNYGFMRWTMVCSYLVLLVLIFWSSHQWINLQRKAIIRPLVVEGRFLMDADSESLVVKTTPLPRDNYYENLDYFRMLFKKQQIPAVICDSFAYLGDDPTSKLHGIRVYKYSTVHDEMIEITKEFLKKRTEFLSRLRELPLRVDFEVKGGGYKFSLGPSKEGRYFALTGYRPHLHCGKIDSIPRNTAGKLFIGLKSYIRFGWESPEGWLTFSPEWFIDFSKDQKIVWER